MVNYEFKFMIQNQQTHELCKDRITMINCFQQINICTVTQATINVCKSNISNCQHSVLTISNRRLFKINLTFVNQEERICQCGFGVLCNFYIKESLIGTNLSSDVTNCNWEIIITYLLTLYFYDEFQLSNSNILFQKIYKILIIILRFRAI